MMERAVMGELPGARFMTYMFDGAIIRMRETDVCRLRVILANVGHGRGLSFTVTPFA